VSAARSRRSRFLDHVAVWQANREEARFIQQSIPTRLEAVNHQ
jgi:hypothetical protein